MTKVQRILEEEEYSRSEPSLGLVSEEYPSDPETKFPLVKDKTGILAEIATKRSKDTSIHDKSKLDYYRRMRKGKHNTSFELVVSERSASESFNNDLDCVFMMNKQKINLKPAFSPSPKQSYKNVRSISKMQLPLNQSITSTIDILSR
jgi:hypothetical protein